MKFGIILEPQGTHCEDIVKVAQEADTLGFDSVWLPDHFFFSKEPYHECWTTLSNIAETTNNVKLGQMVLCNSYRHPALLAKMAATLDVISSGRVILGMGAGWHQREYKAYGITFPEPGIRIRRLRESAQIILKLWTDDAARFNGSNYAIDGVCLPRPIQRPHPPLWIGGSGRTVLKVAARLADGCNFNFGQRLIFTADEFRARLKVLEQHCERTGRNSSEIAASFSALLAMGRDKADVRAEARIALQSLSGEGIHWKRKLALAFRQPSLISAAIKASLGVGQPKFLISGTPEAVIRQLQSFSQAGATYILLNIPSTWKGNTAKVRLFAEKVVDAM